MKSRIWLLWLSCALLPLSFPACIHEGAHTEECEQGLNVSFYSMSRCQSSRGYPEEVTALRLFAFDGDGVLAAYRAWENVTLTASLFATFDLAAGLYSVAAWSGLDDVAFDLQDIRIGTTRREDLLFRLERAAGEAASLEGVRVYSGWSPTVYVGDKTPDSKYVPAEVNLLEVTNRLTVIVEGLPQISGRYRIAVESDNGSMNIDGSLAEDSPVEYPATVIYDLETLESEFTLLKLETGYTNTIVIRDTVEGIELYRGSLLGALLLKNPAVDLNCDHDFTIRFTAEDRCDCGTYAITDIWVNDWLVHSYDTDM